LRSQVRALLPIRRALIVTHSSTWPRRLLPARVAFPLIDAYAAFAARAETWPMEDNLRFHRQLLEHTPLAGSEADVARRAVIEYFQVVEIFWRPWLMVRGDAEGFDYYREARASGRGVVTVFPHFGMPYAQFPIMRRYGIDAWVIASPHHYVDLGDGYDGRFARRGRAYVDMLGPERAVARRRGTDARGAFAPILELLRDGATVSVAFDVVGSMPTPFLGRMVSLASGPPKLAYDADAIVVPFVIRRRKHVPRLKFAPPLDTREFDDAGALQAAIARIMERWALELPEAVWPLHTQPGGPPLIKGPLLATGS
jgi:lauroyl/myristoyl acyltransferase